MRNLTGLEIRQLMLMREAGGLTNEGEILYQRVIGGNLNYDDTSEITVNLQNIITSDRISVRLLCKKSPDNPDYIDDLINRGL